MKISLDLQPCSGQLSGIGLYTYELTKRLKNTSDITFTGNLFNFLYKNDHSQILKHITYSTQMVPFLPYGLYRRIWNICPIPYDSFFGSAEVSHFFNFIVPPKIKGKVINTIFDLTHLYYPETMNKKNYKRISKDIDYSLNRSELLIAISESTKADLIKEYKISSDKVQIIYPSSSLSEFPVNESSTRSKYQITTPYILYVGNLEPRKNIERLIHAYNKLKKENGVSNQLVIAGGKSWNYEPIFQTVIKLNLQDHIVFTGYISDEEKTALYKYASLFVYPALYEGFGMPILEALTCGTPVVCSNTSSMPEVGGMAAYYINPFDTVDMADGIYKMLTDQKLRDSKMQFAKTQSEKFSWDKSAADLMQIYHSFL